MKILIPDEIHMQTFGAKLATLLRGDETIELIGDVGAGKTTLTRALARGLGVTQPIQSPTFTISNRYELPNDAVLAHYDFYRLHDAGIMKDEIAEALADERTMTVIEWGDVVADILPRERLTITITSQTEASRQLTITTQSESLQAAVKGLA